MKKTILFVIIIFSTLQGYSQKRNRYSGFNSASHDSYYISFRKNILPASLITGGILIEAFHVKTQIQDFFPQTNYDIENYIQYVPIGIMYGADIWPVEHENSVFDQTKYLVISELVNAVLTHAFKITIHESRPNGGTHSFPSGHASQSFTCATVLFNEFYDYNQSVASSGYLFSTTTALLRVTNNKHWVPDVLIGAGMGMIVTNLVYYFQPLKNWDPFHFNRRASIIPDLDPFEGRYAVSFIYRP